MKTISNTRKIIIAASISLLLILAVLFISFALPFFTASKILKARLASFENAANNATIQINDPYNSDASLLPTTVDVFLNGEEATAISSEFHTAIQDAKYSGKDTGTHGFWDISISIRLESEISTVYLCENEIYVTDGTSKYSFKPKNDAEYSVFYKKISNMIYEEANSTHGS